MYNKRLGMLLSALVASLFENMLAGQGVMLVDKNMGLPWEKMELSGLDRISKSASSFD